MLFELQDKITTGNPLSSEDIALWWEFHKLPEKYVYNDDYLERFVTVDHIIDDLEWSSVAELIEHLERRHNDIAAHNDSVYGERYLDPEYDDRVGAYIAMQLKYSDGVGGTDWDRYRFLEPRPSYIVNSYFGTRVKFRGWFTGTRPYTPGVAPEDDVMYLKVPEYALIRKCFDPFDRRIVKDPFGQMTFEYWIVGEKLYTIDVWSLMNEIRGNLERARVLEAWPLRSGVDEDDDWDDGDWDDDYSGGGGSGGNDGYSQAELDNHANQCNPNNDAYWSSRA